MDFFFESRLWSYGGRCPMLDLTCYGHNGLENLCISALGSKLSVLYSPVVSLTFGAPVVTMNVHPPALANVSPEVIQARINLEERSLSPACPSVRGRGRLVQHEHVSNGASLGHVVLSLRRGRGQRCTFTCDIAHIIVWHRIRLGQASSFCSWYSYP